MKVNDNAKRLGSFENAEKAVKVVNYTSFTSRTRDSPQSN